MNPKRITKLRRTFIAVATGSFLLVILIMGLIAGLSNYFALAGEANRTLDAIVDAGGEVPAQRTERGPPADATSRLPPLPRLSREGGAKRRRG